MASIWINWGVAPCAAPQLGRRMRAHTAGHVHRATPCGGARADQRRLNRADDPPMRTLRMTSATPGKARAWWGCDSDPAFGDTTAIAQKFTCRAMALAGDRNQDLGVER